MKTMTGPSIVKIEADDLHEFKAVNETLALHLFNKDLATPNKVFGLMDLWKCRKKRRMYGIKVR